MSGVLIVDDDEDIRVMLADLLTGEGYPVATAGHGREAIAYLRSGKLPCIIVLDLMMPVMNGWEFRAEQMKDPVFSSVPTVLFTGVADLAAEAKSLKATGYVTKSAHYHAVLDMVKRYC
ncbi:MAG: response regulator [Candidatus Hydrogenedentota bacterium]